MPFINSLVVIYYLNFKYILKYNLSLHNYYIAVHTEKYASLKYNLLFHNKQLTMNVILKLWEVILCLLF